MNADRQIQALLERAAARVPVDTEKALSEVLRSSRRNRSRHAAMLGIAAALILVALVIVLPRSEGNRGLLQSPLPEGRIAMIVRTESDSRLVGLDLATGVRTELSPGLGSPTAAAWSPDGRSIAFTVEQDEGARYALVVANADGTNPVKLVEHEKAEGTLGPDFVAVSWSPDGSQIAYSGRTIFRGRTVSVIGADGTGERVLDGLWTNVSWSPDGRYLLLQGFPNDGPQGRFDLYRARPDGTEVVQLTGDEFVEYNARWSPDGSQIVFGRADDPDDATTDIYVMNADGSDIRRLTDEPSFDGLPVWSPDGRWIVFASDRDSAHVATADEPVGDVSIYAMRPDGSEVRLVFDGNGNSAVPLSWTNP